MPAATEALDPIMPQYLSELITWTAIGARTTESQTHREMASGLSTPVGFKNGTDGSLGVAINALQSVRHPHHFLGITPAGADPRYSARGATRYGHIVLRGGGGRTNYDSVSIARRERELAKARLPVNIVVDCSHGNPDKDPALQPLVAENLRATRSSRAIARSSGSCWRATCTGALSRSRRIARSCKYGVSVTDACIDWATTERLLLELHGRLSSCARIVPALRHSQPA